MSSPEEPVLRLSAKREDADQIRQRLDPVLKLPEAEMLRLIPERSGIYFVGCPNCDGGTQEGQISWTIERPDETFCRFCGMRYPNEKFPENRVLRVKNPVGVIQEYPCYEAPTPSPRARPSSTPQTEPDEGYRHFFRAKGWFLARAYFAEAALDLAALYHLTGDAAFARRAALILDRFAQVYPGYCVHYDLPFIQAIIFSGDQGFPYPVETYRAAKWDWWAYMDIPENLIRAYDLIRGSGAMDEAMRRRAEDDFFRASVAFTRAIPVTLGNMDPTLLGGLIVAGKVLKEPDYIHHAVDWIGRLVRGQFFGDGMWREGAVSYHNQTVGGLSQLIQLLKGYSDPPGYVHPGDGEHFEDLDLIGRFPILEKARQIPETLKYPDGRVVAFHDTWAGEGKGLTEVSTPALLAGVGHARLGRGRGPHQLQAHLHFSGGYGHQHADTLSITLFSHGHERLGDIGYTHTRHRNWTICTLAHSTVMVDGKDQASGSLRNPSDGNLLFYVPGDETFQVVEAGGDRSYPGVTKVYRRMLVMVGVSPEEAYGVDLFRVSGGERHEYVLVGDADRAGALETDLPRTRYGKTMLPPEVKVQFPTGESVIGDAEGHNIAYAFVRDVQRAAPSGPWTATFTSEGTDAVRVHGIPEPETELLFGAAPSIRRAEEDDGKVDDFTMPMLIARRAGKGLESTYLTVLEPFDGHPFIDKVESLPLEGGAPGDAALRVVCGDRTDYLVFSETGDRTVKAGDLVLQGRLGFVRERGGKVERMTLLGGTTLEKGSLRLLGEGVTEGRITGVLRRAKGDAVNGLLVEGSLPRGERLRGLTVLVKGGGFTCGLEVAGVSEREGRTVLELRDDPGFEIEPDGTGRQCFFPGRSWAGESRFEVANVTTAKYE
ncbi:MAG: hypothetical protein EXS64_07595 [Candidatus Latescibacteria bacterium]|nr:hypothetical protein [Candidatus Latescibacterota bacterium]